MDLQYLKNIAKYAVTAVLSLLIIAYILYHMFGGAGREIETTPASYVTEREKIQLEAYVLRDETVLYSDLTGSVSYLFDNGEKAAVGSTLAAVYSGNDIRDEIVDLENKIQILEASNLTGNLALADTKTVDADIERLYLLMRDKIEQGDINYALRRRDELLTLLNKRQILVNNVENYTSRIASLEAEKQELIGSQNGEASYITTDRSGYFYTAIDGYENIFSSRSISILSLSNFTEMTQSPPENLTESGGKYAIGKLVTSNTWYIACAVPQTMTKSFVEGRNYKVVFPYSADKEITMKLYRVLTEPGSDTSLMIFQSDIVTDGFNFLRRQTVEVVCQSYSGYQVPVASVRMVDGVKGVYILDGSVVRFREVVTLYENNGYFVVEEKDPADESQYKRLGLYDLVITKGRDLYEGKIIG